MSALIPAGVPAAPVRSYAEASHDPHVAARAMLQAVPQADGTHAPITGPAAKFSRTPAGDRCSLSRVFVAEEGCMAREIMITGGTGVLGRAVVERALRDGATCHVTWNFEEELADFPHRDSVRLHEVDCADEAAVAKLYTDLAAVDASIHVVGGFTMAAVEDTTRASFVTMFELNAVTAFLCCREAVKRMRAAGGGRIVNVAARPAVQPAGGMLAYTTAKAAVASLTRCLAEEVRPDGILVNAVLPSIIDTPANRSGMPGADFSLWPRPEQIAEAIAFLAGPENTLTSGTLLPVYGKA